MKPVTDPNILAQLNAPSSIGEAFGHPVTDPNVLAALSGAPHDEDMGIAPVEGPFMNKLRDLAIIGQRGLAGYGRGVASLGEGLKQAGVTQMQLEVWKTNLAAGDASKAAAIQKGYDSYPAPR